MSGSVHDNKAFLGATAQMMTWDILFASNFEIYGKDDHIQSGDDQFLKDNQRCILSIPKRRASGAADEREA